MLFDILAKPEKARRALPDPFMTLGGEMKDRRQIQVLRAGKGFLPDRRDRWLDRRRHHGMTRFLFCDLAALWTRSLRWMAS